MPRPGKHSALNGIYCTSSGNCWAVGEYGPIDNSEANEVLHWNGRKWSQVPVTSPGGTGTGAFSDLFAVRCTSASNCIAIGTQGTFGSTFELQNEALHWNGSKWSTLSTPNPGGTSANGDVSELAGLGCAGKGPGRADLWWSWLTS